MGTPASLLDLIAHGGSLRSSLDNSQIAADTAHTNAATGLTQAQVPLTQQQTELTRQKASQESVDTAIKQQQWKDLQAEMAAWGKFHQAQQAPPQPPVQATPNAGGPEAPQGTPQIATPAINPNAPAANASVANPMSSVMDYGNFLQRANVSGPYAMNRLKEFASTSKDLAESDSKTLENKTKRLNAIGSTAAGYIQNPTADNFQALLSVADENDSESAGTLRHLAAGNPTPTQAQLAPALGHIGALSMITEDALKKKQAAAADATARKTGVEADIQQIKLDGMKGTTPENLSAQVDQIIDPKKYPNQNMRAKGMASFAIQRGEDPSAAVRGVAEEIGAIDKDLDPTVRAAKIEDDKKKADALLPGEIKKAAAIADATVGAHVRERLEAEKGLAKLSPDAFARIYDPTSRRQAMDESDKIDKEYTDKIGNSQQLLDTIHAAQAGNKAAPGVIPIEQVRSVLSNGRVNATELRSVSSQAGSLMDKIEGGLKGYTEGQPIPAAVLRDTAALTEITRQAAKRTYDAGIERLKKRGVDITKITPPTSSSPAATGHVIEIGGKHYQYKGTGDTADIKSYSEVQ